MARPHPPRPLPCACAASRGLVPAPGALAGAARRAPLPPSRRAPLPWRARPAPSRLARPSLHVRDGAAPLLAHHGAFPARRVRGLARSAPGAAPLLAQRVRPRCAARRVRNSAPACMWLVRGACSRGARGALARLVVPSARRVASCRGWCAHLPLDVPVYT
jgi:hypothetical protein